MHNFAWRGAEAPFDPVAAAAAVPQWPGRRHDPRLRRGARGPGGDWHQRHPRGLSRRVRRGSRRLGVAADAFDHREQAVGALGGERAGRPRRVEPRRGVEGGDLIGGRPESSLQQDGDQAADDMSVRIAAEIAADGRPRAPARPDWRPKTPKPQNPKTPKPQ